MPVKDEVYFGIASSGIYNAYAQTIPSTKGYLIIIEDEIFTLCHMLAKLVVQGLPGLSIDTCSFSFRQEVIEKHLEESVDIQTKFNDLLVNGVLRGRPTYTKQYYLDEKLVPFGYEILRSLELFVIAHEYGHISAGHLGNVTRKRFVKQNTDAEVVQLSWEQEFEADMIGTNLMLNTIEVEKFQFSFIGAELFF